jgi:hypothetical protein
VKTEGPIEARLLESAKTAVLWTREGLAGANFPEERFRIEFVTSSANVANSLREGKARSPILSRLVNEIRDEVKGFDSWTVEVKQKGK